MHTRSQIHPRARRALLRHQLASALAIGLTCSALGAQANTVDDIQAADATSLDTIVVTGLATGRSQKDAPLAISVLSETLIDRWPPAANVEILRSIPGFSVESSGGRGGGQNIFARGLPDGGWSFMQYQEDGLTLFDEPQEGFFNVDALFSLDMMTQRLEAVRGGTAPVFSTNALGGTVNAITRRGTPVAEGAARLSRDRSHLWRADAYSAGPLSANVLYAVGGHFRQDDGLRKPGFTANKGGQLRGNLTFLLGDVTLDVDAKLLNDRTAFYTGIPLADPRDPSRSLAQWIDPLKGTLMSEDLRYTTVRGVIGTTPFTRRLDLADGIHNDVKQFGSKLAWEPGNGLSLENHLRYIDAKVSYTALFSGDAPFAADDYLQTQLGRAQGGFSGVDRVGYVYSRDGLAYNPADDSGLVLEIGLWNAHTRLRALSDDVRLSKAFDEGGFGQHTLTVGLNVQRFKYEHEHLFTTLLTTLEHRAQRLDVRAYDSAGNVVGSVTEDGFVRYGFDFPRGQAEGTYLSPYLWDSVKFGRFGLDAGIRFTRQQASGGYHAEFTADLGDPDTLADDNVGAIGEMLIRRSQRHNAVQWTLGGEFALSPNLHTFARYTSSERLPRLSNVYRNDNWQMTSVDQVEFGLRGTPGAGFSFSNVLFGNRFNELSIGFDTLVNGRFQRLELLGKTRTVGLESEFTWRPSALFSMSGSLTLQKPEIRSLSDTNTGTAYPDLDGKQIARIPERIISLTPALHLAPGGRPLDISLTAYHMGERFVDYANLTALPAYTTYDLNLFAQLGEHLELQLSASNLGNKIGLTEGNPRVDILSGQDSSTAIYARPIFARNYTASLTWRW